MRPAERPSLSASQAGEPQFVGNGNERSLDKLAPWGGPTVESGQCHSSQGVEVVEELKLNEQSGNVYENKGPLWKTRKQSGNVIENKHSYAQDPGMLLKRKGLDGVQRC
jgi:hypothetical protein